MGIVQYQQREVADDIRQEAKIDFAPIQTTQMPLKEKILQRLWNIFRPLVWGCSPFFARKWRRLWLLMFSRMYSNKVSKVSKNASISRTARIDYPWRIEIGDKSSIGEKAWCYALDKITIGSNCCIGDEERLEWRLTPALPTR